MTQKEIEVFEATEEILVPLQAEIEEMLNTPELSKFTLQHTINKYFDKVQEVTSNLAEIAFGDNSIERLTKLQATLSGEYQPGKLSVIALLGLLGEAGEVLNEVEVMVQYHDQQDSISKAIRAAREVEEIKKLVRSGNCLSSAKYGNLADYDSELGDVAYYLNILATNRGLTLFDLCQMGYDKIKAKQLSGGSSEERKS